VSSFFDSGFDRKSDHKVLLHNSTSNQQPVYSTSQNGPVSCPRQWGMWGGGRANRAISSYGLQFPPIHMHACTHTHTHTHTQNTQHTHTHTHHTHTKHTTHTHTHNTHTALN